MALKRFLAETLKKNREQPDEMPGLQKILDLLRRREPKIYSVSVTSNA